MRTSQRVSLAIFMSLGVMSLVAIYGCSNSTDKNSVDQIACGGSTFVGPIMSEWVKGYEKAAGVKVDYALVGSGNGIRQMSANIYAFGCCDATMNKEQIEAAKEKGGEVVHLPIVMGPVAVAYNLKDVKEPVKFTGETIAAIFLGKIKKWNDPALLKLNPNLPDLDIKVIHRSDPSGTTNVFTNYLAKVSDEWKSKVGSNFDVKWPVGDGANKSEGVTNGLIRTPGSIGYMEVSFVIDNKDTIAAGSVRNKAGKDVQPTPESTTAAAEKTEIPDDLQFMLTDADGEESYPIAGTVYAVLYKKQTTATGKAVVDFLRWVTTDGQKMAASKNYAPLSKNIVDRVSKKLDAIELPK